MGYGKHMGAIWVNATKSTHNITHHPTHHPASTLPHQEIEAAPHGKLIPFLHCGLRFPNNGDPPAGIGVSQDVHLFKGRGRGGGLSRVNLTVFSNNLDTFGETFWPTPISNINQSHKTPPNQNHVAQSFYLDLKKSFWKLVIWVLTVFILLCATVALNPHIINAMDATHRTNKQTMQQLQYVWALLLTKTSFYIFIFWVLIIGTPLHWTSGGWVQNELSEALPAEWWQQKGCCLACDCLLLLILSIRTMSHLSLAIVAQRETDIDWARNCSAIMLMAAHTLGLSIQLISQNLTECEAVHSLWKKEIHNLGWGRKRRWSDGGRISLPGRLSAQPWSREQPPRQLPFSLNSSFSQTPHFTLLQFSPFLLTSRHFNNHAFWNS